MMDERVAKILDRLLAEAEPITLEMEWKEHYTPVISRLGPDNLMEALSTAIESQYPQAIEDEIASAASEQRPTSFAWKQGTTLGKGGVCAYEGAPRRALDLARPLMQAILDAHNAASRLTYEIYRTACEQRVAVAPPENTSRAA